METLEDYEDAVSDWIRPESLGDAAEHARWLEHVRRSHEQGLSPQECAAGWAPKPMN